MGKIIIIMGVSGSGKSTLGIALGQAFSIPFIEGDDFHTKANIDKMKSKIPLTDEDRKTWLITLSKELSKHFSKGVILACSALKASYRELLCNSLLKKSLFWIYLDCNSKELKKRLEGRDHFMPHDLLQSQLDALEEPKDALYLNNSQSINEMIEQIKRELNE